VGEGENLHQHGMEVEGKAVTPILAQNVSVQMEKNINDQSHTVDVTMHFTVHPDKVIQ
jgi:hypothetical protein